MSYITFYSESSICDVFVRQLSPNPSVHLTELIWAQAFQPEDDVSVGQSSLLELDDVRMVVIRTQHLAAFKIVHDFF